MALDQLVSGPTPGSTGRVVDVLVRRETFTGRGRVFDGRTARPACDRDTRVGRRVSRRRGHVSHGRQTRVVERARWAGDLGGLRRSDGARASRIC